MLRLFRVVSILEGCSYLALLTITLGFVSRDFVAQLGMLHGVLFMLYLFLLSGASRQQKWSLVTHLSLFAASLVPFAFIGVELFLSKQLVSKKTASA